MSINHFMNDNKSKNSTIQSTKTDQDQHQNNMGSLSRTVQNPPIDQNIQQKKKQNKQADDALNQHINMDKEAWKKIREYRKTGADVAKGDYDENWDSFTLEELVQILELRSNTKSKSFHVMKNALSDLMKYAKNEGLKEKKNNNHGPIDLSQYQDFQDAFYRARIATSNFVYKHNSIFNYVQTDKNTRYQAAVRIGRLLDDMEKEVKIAQAAFLIKQKEEEAKESPEQKKDLRIVTLLKVGDIKDLDKEQKVGSEWIDKDYQEKLRALLNGKDDFKTDEEFLKFLTDKKNILTSRKLAIVLYCEENSKKTLDIPALSEELKSYIEESIKDDPLMYEGEFSDFKNKISSLTDNFLKDNKKRIEVISHRQEVMKVALDVQGNAEGLFKNDEVSNMLMSYSDEQFGEELVSLYNAQLQNDALIASLVKERISVVNQKEIIDKVKTMLGTARIFSSVNNMIDMVGAALDVVLFSNSEAALSEQRFRIIMSQFGIAKTYRDAFAFFYQKNADGTDEVKLVKKFGRQMIENEKSADSMLKKLKLSPKAWQKIDGLLRYSGAFSNDEFNAHLSELIKKNKPEAGEKTVLRKEYILGKETNPSKNYASRSEAYLRGKLLLGSEEIKNALSKEDIAVLQKNLTSVVLNRLSSYEGSNDLTVLDNLTPRELRMLGNLIKRDILANASKLNALKGDLKKNMIIKVAAGEVENEGDFENISKEEKDYLTKESEKAKRRLYAHIGNDLQNCILIRNALKPTEGLSEEEKDKAEKENYSLYGVRSRSEMKDVMKKFGEEPELYEKSKALSEQLDRQKKYLKDNYKDRRYRSLLDHLMEIPEVVDAMLDTDEKSFVNFCRNVIDVKLKDFASAFNKTPESEIHKKTYLDQNFRDIYMGNRTSTDWERDISDFCEIEFAKKQEYIADTRWDRIWKWTYEKFGFDTRQSRDENISKATEKIKDKIWKTYGKNARYGMLDKAFVYWSSLINSTDEKNQKAFNSVNELTRLGFLGITNHETNQKMASEFIALKINRTPELKAEIKADDEKNGKKNMELFQAQFASFLSRDAILLNEDAFEKKLQENMDEFLVYYRTTMRKMEGSLRSEKELKEFEKANKKAVDKIAERKKLGVGIRDRFLRIDNNVLNEVIEAKTLVGDPREMVIRKGRREYEWQRLDSFADRNFPNIVKSCVVERSLSHHLKDGEFLRHLSHLDYIYRNISDHLGEGADKFSDDEKGLFTVFIYKQADHYGFFKEEKLPDINAIVKLPLFKEFRENYKLLRSFETMEVNDKAIMQEKDYMSRNLRVLISQGAGLIDKFDASFDLSQKLKEDTVAASAEYGNLFRETVQRHIEYVKYKSEAYSLIGSKLRALKPMSDYAYERYMYALREYYQYIIVDDCHSKKTFSTKEWEKRLSRDLNDEALMRNLRGQDGANTGLRKDFERENSIDDGYSMADIEKLILDKTIMPGMFNKFMSLDNDQKRLFVLALMMMDKSAIGSSIGGTNEVLHAPGEKTAKQNAAEQAITDYLQGKEMTIVLDYQDAQSKLLNVGEYFLFSDSAVLSTTAFDEALKFAQDMKLQKEYNTDRDLERIGDGMTSVMEAARLFGKPQFEIVKKLSNRVNTLSDVKNELFDMANKEDVPDIAGQIGNMNERDLRLFVKILKNRTLLDDTTIKHKGAERIYADSDARRDLIDALVGEETREAELSDAASKDSCLKALATAYSFQMRDDITRKGTHLTKKHFLEKSIERETLIDWDLIKKAYNLMTEIKQKQVQTHMLRNASEYIEESGNEKAVTEYRKLKEKQGQDKSTTLEDFEDYILKSADSEEVKDVVAGYMSFTDAQKKLFIKALGRRDILDISRKNLFSDLFNLAERDYVNKADRYALIDEYVAGSMQSGGGVVLKQGAHYDALASLFSTQMSDTEGIEAYGGVKSKMVGERVFFAQRSTAIDWKLFRRAVSFVNRACKELEYAEGQGELYRSAGSISENGEFQMDYSQLRKNYHKTGRSALRFITGNVAGRILNFYKLGKISGEVVDIADDVDSLLGNKFLDQRKLLNNLSVGMKGINNPSAKKITKLKLENKINTVNEESELAYDVLKKNIDQIILDKGNIERSMSAIVDYIKAYGYFPENGQKIKTNNDNGFLKKGKAPEGIEEIQYKYGDIRDYKPDAEVYKVGKTIYDYAYTQMLKSYGNELLKEVNVKELLDKGEVKSATELSQKLVKERFEAKLKEKLGKEETDKLLKATVGLKEAGQDVSKILGTVLKTYNYASSCAKNIGSIVQAGSKYSSLNSALKYAKDKEASDKEKLKTAEKYQTDAQKEQNKKTVENQEMLMKLGVDLSKIDKAGEIPAAMFNIIVDTVNLNKMVLSGNAGLISETISGAVELCIYLTTMALDKSKIADYFRNTEDGKQTVQKLIGGLKKVYSKEPEKVLKIEKSYADQTITDDNLLQLIRRGLGYQNNDELMADTCMKVAQNVIFCASRFNPMAQNKIMATAVLSAMGLAGSIEDTSPAAVEKLYKKMNKAV